MCKQNHDAGEKLEEEIEKEEEVKKERQLDEEPLVEETFKQIEVVKKKSRQVRIYTVLSFLLAVVIVPAMITIILAAFEEKTNDWVYQVLGLEKPETTVEKIKRLATNGNLIHYKCGPIGTRVSEVLKTCDKPTRADINFEVTSATHTLYYAEGDQRLTTLDFSNYHLKSAAVIDKGFASIKLSEIKKTLGEPDMPEPFKFEFDNTVYLNYDYILSPYKLSFRFNDNKNILEQISIENMKSSPPLEKKNQHTYLTVSQPLPHDKTISRRGGVTAVRQIKKWLEKGDIIHYDCGPLGTSLDEVKSRCGDESKMGSLHFDHQESKDHLGLGYKYKERQIRLTFYKKRLTYITIQEEKNLPITRNDVLDVFGKPIKDKSAVFPNVELLKYRINDKEVTFYFDNHICNSIQLKKAGMYDDEFGKLLPKYRNQQ
ncbi:DUF4309 domain-containing protein [Paenactinomyces guangxiensis]|uniref:DUF4309 domain-containing protein n=1 Tax=Paenactinomyces guangxiensis TaxID=1490290 RepID=A0A7W1WV24_9BACL|nr:DUF4309 domain-containing protein [Paenactinomyces guangxiensis]MBA4496537.1 DUF4309 domain-containing protein [Paenactinomyces guangxiensis]MBH8593662.1 DUF4309 domain-containing protein [Paenactinomyces guangxiensis]